MVEYFGIYNCSKLLQWHITRAGMVRLLVDKNISVEAKQLIVAHIISAIHILFETQIQRLCKRAPMFEIRIGDNDVRQWIQNQDVHEFRYCTQERQLPRGLSKTFIGIQYSGVINGINFKIPMIMQKAIACRFPECKEKMCNFSCGGCGFRYCGPEHQLEDWPQHQDKCDNHFFELVNVFKTAIVDNPIKGLRGTDLTSPK